MNLKRLSVLAISLLMGFVFAGTFNSSAVATQDKILWCHFEPNENSQTLKLPMTAITNAGHADASGNPLHAGDHEGACEDNPDPLDLCSNIEDAQSELPEGYYAEDGACYPKTPVCNDDSAKNYGGEDGKFDGDKEVANNELCEYDDVVPTTAPTNTPSNGGNGGGDGRSDGLSSCPECTKAPQGQVLGASTMAKTGGFEQNLMNLFGIVGTVLASAGVASYRKEKTV